jgi:hypothetical protein
MSGHKTVILQKNQYQVLISKKISLPTNYSLEVIYRGRSVRVDWFDNNHQRRVGLLTSTNLISTIVGYESGINKKGYWAFLDYT